ncbi:MAG: hypothetical protein R2754_13620 [Microthrixaceae bacterium]
MRVTSSCREYLVITMPTDRLPLQIIERGTGGEPSTPAFDPSG